MIALAARFGSVVRLLLIMTCALVAPRFAHGEDVRKPRIVFLGDSLTAGFGLSQEEAYPMLVEGLARDAKLPVETVNAGVSGDTSAGGVRRLPWLLKQHIDVLVIELGANDGLRGLDLAATKRNLLSIIDRTRERYPAVRVVLAGMELPPTLGESYTKEFRAMFVDVAESRSATLIPFLLEQVAGVPSLNQPDRIHPTSEGQRVVAKTVWSVLEPLIREHSVS